MHSIWRRRTHILVAAVLLVQGSQLRGQLNQNCTVSILNRNAQVDTNGNWQIDNFPSGFAVRAVATCVNNGSMQWPDTASDPQQGAAAHARSTPWLPMLTSKLE